MSKKNVFFIISVILFAISLWRFIDSAIYYEPSWSYETGKSVEGDQMNDKKDSDNIRNLSDDDMRKIFVSRRYTEMPEHDLQVIAPPPPERIPEMVLKGIIKHDDGTYTAFIEIDKVVIPLRKGEGIDNISVIDITERRISIKWKDQQLQLSL